MNFDHMYIFIFLATATINCDDFPKTLTELFIAIQTNKPISCYIPSYLNYSISSMFRVLLNHHQEYIYIYIYIYIYVCVCVCVCVCFVCVCVCVCV
jgi:hypothetical protein